MYTISTLEIQLDHLFKVTRLQWDTCSLASERALAEGFHLSAVQSTCNEVTVSNRSIVSNNLWPRKQAAVMF